MTNFERTYILNKHRSKIAVERENQNGKKSDVIDLTDFFQKQREEFAMQMQYRELDRVVMELEKEIQAIRVLRMEMEKYKVDFELRIEDEATKKIQEVVNDIDKMFK